MEDINKIQKFLMQRLDRLNDDKYMKDNLKDEIARSNTVTNASLAYIKVENLKMKINNLSREERETIKKFSK